MAIIKKLICILFGIFVLCHSGFAIPAYYKNTLLVIDSKDSNVLPRNFRTTDQIPATQQPINWSGFTDLKMVGTSQFTEKSLLNILNKLGVKHIIDIDLRQESHGFLNEDAISWYGPQDAENAKLPNNQIIKRENALLSAVATKTNIKLYEILSKNEDGYIDDAKMNLVPVQQTMNEKTVIEKYGLSYVRLFVQDFHAPSNQEVDRFIAFIKKLPTKHSYILLHCHAGVGRTTLFMVMVDMMHNAKTVSFDDILTRQTLIGGRDLRDISDPNNFKHKTDICRLDFLKRFYQYAQLYQNQFDITWSSWNRNQPKDPACLS